MDRREFLALSGVAAAGSVLAGSAFAFARGADGEGPERHPHESDVGDELAVAAALGKPLLVLVRPPMPIDGRDREGHERLWERESTYGSWLRHGGAATWAHLALTHVTSASVEELRAAIPDFVVPGGGVPWLVLVETGALEPRTAVAGDALPPGLDEGELLPWGRDREEAERRAEARVARNNAALDAWLSELLDDDDLPERARQSLAVLSDDERAALDAALADPGAADGALLRRAAAVALHRAATEADLPSDAIVGALASASASRLHAHAPRGAHWASSGGCGAHTVCDMPEENATRWAVSCGMGHVPDVSRHFLELFAEH